MNYGRYEIIGEVGRGAMGVVYQARDPQIDRLVAVKVLRQDRVENEAFVRRFLKEAKVIGRLSHPHIVTIYDVGEENGNIYIAMEFLDGSSLADLIRQRRPDAREVAELGIQIAETLDYAHRKGVVHRDIKPSNIIVQKDGGIKITDFGIARVEDASSTLQTQTGEILGTPAYMSPEQVMGNPVDGRSDIFSLGVILYEMATGKRPFGGEARTLATVFTDIIQITPPEPALVSPLIGKELSRCIMKALEKDLSKRFQSGSELAEAIRKSLADGKEGIPRLPAAPPKKRGPAVIVAALSVVAAAAVGGYLLISGNRGEKVSPPTAPSVETPLKTEKPHPPDKRMTGPVPAEPPVTDRAVVEPPKTMQEVGAGKTSRRRQEALRGRTPQKSPPPGKSSEPGLPLLTVRTTPQGADIYIDGVLKGKAPLTLKLGRGGHRIRAVRSGYEDMERSITVEEATEYPLVLNLKEKAEPDDWVVKPLIDRPGK